MSDPTIPVPGQWYWIEYLVRYAYPKSYTRTEYARCLASNTAQSLFDLKERGVTWMNHASCAAGVPPVDTTIVPKLIYLSSVSPTSYLATICFDTFEQSEAFATKFRAGKVIVLP